MLRLGKLPDTPASVRDALVGLLDSDDEEIRNGALTGLRSYEIDQKLVVSAKDDASPVVQREVWRQSKQRYGEEMPRLVRWQLLRHAFRQDAAVVLLGVASISLAAGLFSMLITAFLARSFLLPIGGLGFSAVVIVVFGFPVGASIHTNATDDPGVAEVWAATLVLYWLIIAAMWYRGITRHRKRIAAVGVPDPGAPAT